MVNFVLTALNTDISLSTSASIPDYSPSITSDATITLTAPVSKDLLQSVFYFRTDDPITMDASFVYYYVNANVNWPDIVNEINPKNGLVTSNGYVSNDNVSKDFIRDLARQLFGTYLGADMFTNEDQVVFDINSKCDSVAASIGATFEQIDITMKTNSSMFEDSSGNMYHKDDTSVTNISREMFNILMTSAPSRFVDISGNFNYNLVQDGFYKMPILAGDTITFKLTINAADGQADAVNTGLSVLTPRTYTVILNVGA